MNIDFKGPVFSSKTNRFFLTVKNDFSRFLFVFPCVEVSASNVISCLLQFFSVFGRPEYIHSDRGSAFLSTELTSFLNNKGVACSTTTPYHHKGNGQCERYNGVIWKAISFAVKSQKLPEQSWELVLADALHSIRS